MYSRITAAFFAPQELVNYKRDRFWRPLLIVLLTLLFICLPGIIRTADKSISLSEKKKYNIKLAFNTNKPIGLKLVDGEIKFPENFEALVYDIENFDTKVVIGELKEKDTFSFFTSTKTVYIGSKTIKYLEGGFKEWEYNYKDLFTNPNLNLDELSSFSSPTWEYVFNSYDSILKKNIGFEVFKRTALMVVRRFTSQLLLTVFIVIFLVVRCQRLIKIREIITCAIYLLLPYFFYRFLIISFAISWLSIINLLFLFINYNKLKFAIIFGKLKGEE